MKRKDAILTVPSSATALLLPEQLAAKAADAVRELLAEAAAANTTRSYATALRYWAGWYQARFSAEMTLPLSESTVIQFLVDHILRKSKSRVGRDSCKKHRFRL